MSVLDKGGWQTREWRVRLLGSEGRSAMVRGQGTRGLEMSAVAEPGMVTALPWRCGVIRRDKWDVMSVMHPDGGRGIDRNWWIGDPLLGGKVRLAPDCVALPEMELRWAAESMGRSVGSDGGVGEWAIEQEPCWELLEGYAEGRGLRWRRLVRRDSETGRWRLMWLVEPEEKVWLDKRRRGGGVAGFVRLLQEVLDGGSEVAEAAVGVHPLVAGGVGWLSVPVGVPLSGPRCGPAELRAMQRVDTDVSEEEWLKWATWQSSRRVRCTSLAESEEVWQDWSRRNGGSREWLDRYAIRDIVMGSAAIAKKTVRVEYDVPRGAELVEAQKWEDQQRIALNRLLGTGEIDEEEYHERCSELGGVERVVAEYAALSEEWLARIDACVREIGAAIREAGEKGSSGSVAADVLTAWVEIGGLVEELGCDYMDK